jgi:hypothetical protein
MPLFVAALIVAGGVLGAAAIVRRAIEASARTRTVLDLLSTFAPAVAAARDDPRALLVWYPLARSARRLFPEAFRQIDDARGTTFPFTSDDVQAAHARWTAEWLAWERTHDADYKLRASAMEQEVARGAEAGTAAGRGRVEAVEREKLERYQQRYEEYIRTAKALQALLE